jgi:hypothetical protein
VSNRQIIIRNWDKFQHKDVWRKSGGRPPWIKAYTRLLHDDEFLALTHAQRGILLGLWLLRASSGQDPYEAPSRRLLSTNKGESRHFQANLEALNRAGFIEFLSQPMRERVATREEKSRENKDTNKEHVEGTNEATPLIEQPLLQIVASGSVLREF